MYIKLLIEMYFFKICPLFHFHRYQLEREIRHKIKKGDFSEIPKDVLDTMAPAMLAPPKGKDVGIL